MITPATSSPAIWACLTPECLRTKPEYFVSLLLSVILFWYPPAVTTLVLILYMCRGSVGWGIMAPPTACKYNHHNEKTRTGRKKRSAICLNRTTSAFLVNNTFSNPECPFASWAFSLLRKKNIKGSWRTMWAPAGPGLQELLRLQCANVTLSPGTGSWED